jgi:hypothetical protein
MSQQINLFNPVFLQKGKHFSSVAMAQALAVLVVGASVIGGYTSYQMGVVKREAGMTTTRLKTAQAQLDTVANQGVPKEKSKALEEELRTAEADIRSEQKVIEFLKTGEFGNTRGYSEYFKAFGRQIGSGIWLTGFTIMGPGTDIGVQGRALRADMVPAYLGRLKNEPVFRGKSFAAIEMKTVQAVNAAAAAQGRTELNPGQAGGIATTTPVAPVPASTASGAFGASGTSKPTPEAIVQTALQAMLGQATRSPSQTASQALPVAAPVPVSASVSRPGDTASAALPKLPAFVEFSIVSTGLIPAPAQDGQLGAPGTPAPAGPALSIQLGGPAR